MVIMSIRLNNFMSFNEFRMSFSYPKKIVHSYLSEEHLHGFPSFRYKKLIILMGANASGKTSLGQMVNRILMFLRYQNPSVLLEVVRDSTREAHLTLDFVVGKGSPELYRVGIIVTPSEQSLSSEDVFTPSLRVCVKKTKIGKRDKYEKAQERVAVAETDYEYSYVEKLRGIPPLGYFFSYPSDVMPMQVRQADSEKYRVVLETILKVLDPSIVGVERVVEANNSYSVKFIGGSSVLIQNGSVVKTSLLSSGTKAGIAIADMLTAIMKHENGFYYCDEKFSYIQSDVECALLGLMTEHLGENEQIFFTTQNTDILDLPYPKHSYMFLRKTIEDGEVRIRTVNADSYLKRNTDVLRCAVANDLFSTAPNIDALLSLGGDKGNAN